MDIDIDTCFGIGCQVSILFIRNELSHTPSDNLWMNEHLYHHKQYIHNHTLSIYVGNNPNCNGCIWIGYFSNYLKESRIT